jgi:hypothetical protein
MNGVHNLAESLLRNHKIDVRCRSTERGATPLLLEASIVVASYNGLVSQFVHDNLDKRLNFNKINRDDLFDSDAVTCEFLYDKNYWVADVINSLIAEACKRYSHMLNDIREDHDLELYQTAYPAQMYHD